MATATIYAGAGDGFIRRGNSGAESWATLRNATSGSDVGPTSTADFGVAARKDAYLYRLFLPFDLSSIPDGSDITAVDIYVYVTAKASGGGGTTANNSVTVVESTQASATTLVADDYDNVGSTEFVASRSSFSGMTTSAYNTFSLNAAGIAAAQAAANGNTYLKVALRSGYDLDNVAPTPDTAISDFETRYSEYASTTYDPYLVVTYTPAPRTTSDSWAWSDSLGATGGGGTTFNYPRSSSDTWAWSDSATVPYWRANRTPVLVQAAGATTTLNGSHSLPTTPITVASTSGFASSGTIVLSAAGTQTAVTYTGKTGTTFTGCSGGSGTCSSGSAVLAADSENSFPQVVELDTGTDPDILVAFIQKPGHAATVSSTIVSKTSTNGGLTWASAVNIVSAPVNSGYGIGGFVLKRLLNGRLLAMWYESNGPLVKTYSSYSDDAGGSWSTPARLTSPYPGGTDVCAVGFGTALYTGSGSNGTYGDLYVTCYGNDSATYDNTATYNRLMKVTDGGTAGTWTSVGTINTLAQLDGRASEEASLVILDDGTWVSHLRVELLAPTYTTLDRYQATSNDLGVTWSGHTRIAQNLGNAAVSHQLPTGELLTQGEEFTVFGRGVPTSTITFISSDRGASWPALSWRQEETDGTYTGGVGSDFETTTDTSVPRRRVLNAYSQESGAQTAAQVKFQWYSAPWVTDDTWTWSDAATGTSAKARTTSDTWAWSDSAAKAASYSRVSISNFSSYTPDTWSWHDIVTIGAGGIFARTSSDTWAWTDTATQVGSGNPAVTTADTWAWADALARTIAASRTTSDLWLWTEPQATPTTPLFWLRARRRTMSAPVKTYVQVIPRGTARTSSFTSPTYEARTEAGILVILDVTSASGTGGLTLRINAHDQASSQSVPLNAAPTAVAAVGTTSYALYPFGAVAGNVTQATEFYLPRLFSISVTAGDSSSYTYSLGYCLLP